MRRNSSKGKTTDADRFEDDRVAAGKFFSRWVSLMNALHVKCNEDSSGKATLVHYREKCSTKEDMNISNLTPMKEATLEDFASFGLTKSYLCVAQDVGTSSYDDDSMEHFDLGKIFPGAISQRRPSCLRSTAG